MSNLSKKPAPQSHMASSTGMTLGAVSHQQARLEQVWVSLLDKFRTTQDVRDDYKGSQMHLANDSCVGAHRPFGLIYSNLMRCLDHFGLDYRGGWKLLMDDRRWAGWKQEHGFAL